MSADRDDMVKDELHELVGAYALDALDDVERVRFERHLESCEACREELAELRQAVTALATEEAQHVPSHVRENVFAQIEREGSPAAATHSGSGRRVALFATAAAALVVLALVGLSLLRPADLLEDIQTAARQGDVAEIERLVAESDELRLTESSANGARAQLVTASDGSVLVVEGLPSLSQDQTYQAWFVTSSGPQPAEVLDSDGDWVGQLTALETDVQAVAITAEPAGGSEAPTTPVLIEVPAT